MLQKVLTVMLTLALTVAAQGLKVTDVRGWGSWPAQITSADFSVLVDGMVARTVLTLTIKDTLSTTYSDSLEATFNFNLPRYSVVDSLYLWIKGEAVPAYLKEYVTAIKIYESIVKRRVDPALLRKTTAADNYTLQVFPFSRREERKVRICYTTPLSVNDKSLLLAIPLDMTGCSAFPLNATTITARFKYLAPQDISIAGTFTGESTVAQSGIYSVLTFVDRNRMYCNPLHIAVRNPEYDSLGAIVNFSEDATGDVSFAAMLNPEKLFGVSKAKSNNVLIVWNNVTVREQWDLAQYKYVPVYSYYYDNYFQQYLEKDKNDIVSFIRTHCRENDKLNIVINDDDIQPFSASLVPVTAGTADEVRAFLDKSMSTTSKYSGCEDPRQAILKGLATIGTPGDEMTVIIIDKSNYYSYYKGPIDTVQLESNFATIKSQLPAKSKLFGMFGQAYSYPSPVSRLYQKLFAQYRGLIIPTYSYATLEESFKSVVPYLYAKFYPVNMTSLGANVGYSYDVFLPMDYYARVPVMCFGKLHNSPRLRILFNGVVDGKEYQFDKSFDVKTGTITDRLCGRLWAAEKVSRMLRESGSSAASMREAAAISLNNRVLTPATALLALEKGVVDSALYHDDVASGFGSGGPTAVNKQAAKNPGKIGVLALQQGGIVKITLNGLDVQKSGAAISLKVFDIKGKLIADLSDLAGKGVTTIRWNCARVPAGMYIVKLEANKKVCKTMLAIVK